jgi:2-isopropylmalate synthase
VIRCGHVNRDGSGRTAQPASPHLLSPLPRGLQIGFARNVQAITDARGGELTADELLAEFHNQYLDITRPYEIVSYTHSSGEHDQITAQVAIDGQLTELHSSGNVAVLAHLLWRHMKTAPTTG